MFSYTVRCRFSNPDIAKEWFEWLRNDHVQDVIDCGADSAEIVKMDSVHLTFEIRYQFLNRNAFEEYEQDHAHRLRKEGLLKYPLTLGLEYERTTGEVVFDSEQKP